MEKYFNFFLLMVKRKKMLTVKLFYAEWCGACRNFKPDWEKIVQRVMDSKYSNRVKFEKYNIDQNRDLAESLSINGIPTIIFYFEGKNYKYSGERNIEQIIRKIQKICDERF